MIGVVVAVAALLPASPAFARPLDVGCPTTGLPDLSGKTITDVATLPHDLRCANLKGAVLDGLDLTQTDLRHVDAEGASFRHVDLSQADLDFADLRGAHFDHATLDQADLVEVNATGAYFPHASLTQADLTDADFAHADLDLATLTQADLTRTDLRGASLWATGSVMAHGGGTRLSLIQPGVVPLMWVMVAVALFYLVRGIVVVAAPLRWSGGRPWRARWGRTGWQDAKRSLGPVAVFAVVTFVVGLLGKQLAPLQFMNPILPGVVAVVVMAAGCLLSGPRQRISEKPLILGP